MEKGWWGESPPSDRQNRLPEPEQHGGACPGGRQPVPAGVLLCCAPAPEPSGGRAASGREPSAPCPASEDWHRSFCPSHREYGQRRVSLYRKIYVRRSSSPPEPPPLAGRLARGSDLGGGSALVIRGLTDGGNDLLFPASIILSISCLLLTREQERHKLPTWSGKVGVPLVLRCLTKPD